MWHKDSGGKESGSIFATGDFIILDEKIYLPDYLNKSIHIYDMEGKYLKTVLLNNSYAGMLGVGDYIVFSAKNTPSEYNEANQNVVFYNKYVDENSNPVVMTYELNEEYLDSVFGQKN